MKFISHTLLALGCPVLAFAIFGGTLEEALDAPGLVWTTGGNDNWVTGTSPTFDGVDSAVSGFILDNQETFLETTVEGAGLLSFRWRVSSQAGGDFLRFSLNGAEPAGVTPISGEVDWKLESIQLPEGTNTLRWAYTKDASGSAGFDGGWLDVVNIRGDRGSFVFQEGNGYTGTVDTHVTGADPETDLGLSTTVLVDGENLGNPSHGLLRFENLFGSDANQVLPGDHILQATLSLYTENPGTPINIHRMVAPWDDTITWSNLVNGIQANNVEAAAFPSGSVNPAVVDVRHTIDVTADLQAWANGGTNLGWALLPTDINGWRFTSSEGTVLVNRPELRIETGTGVAPAFTDPALPADLVIEQGRSGSLQAPPATGELAPTLQWFRNGVAVAGETGTSLTITNTVTPAIDAYSVVALNASGSATSRIATVTINADTTAPLYADGVNLLDGTVQLIFNEPMNTASNATTLSSLRAIESSAPSNTFDFASFTWPDETTLLLVPAAPLSFGNLDIVLDPGAVTDAWANPVAAVDEPLGREVVQFLAGQQTWAYDQSGDELVTNALPFFAPAFDDSAWPRGLGLLGTETGATPEPIRTPVLNSGAGGPITTYYRTRFDLIVPAADVRSLRLRTVMDDGAVVYLNGNEAFRLGVDPGQSSTNLASRTATDGAFEGPFDLAASNLVEGVNLFATELHQASATSSDNLWDAELVLVVDRVREIPPAIQVQPDPGPFNLAEGGGFTLSVSAGGTPPLSYQWLLDGVPITGATSTTYSVSNAVPPDAGTYTVEVSNPFGPVLSSSSTVVVDPDATGPRVLSAYALMDGTRIAVEFSEALDPIRATNAFNYALQEIGGGVVPITGITFSGEAVTLSTDPRPRGNYRLSMRNQQDLAFTPNLLDPNPTITNLPTQSVLFDLADPHTTWRYNDRGQDEGSAWKEPLFDDSSWSEGSALFYLKTGGGAPGNNDLSTGTVLSPTNSFPAITNALATTRVVTYYYRHQFVLPFDPAAMELQIRAIIDDGAIFHVNGQEALRVGMPTGAVDYVTLSLRGETNDQFWEDGADLDSSLFHQGTNTLAVEVHQVQTTSSDNAFAMQLLVKAPTDYTGDLAIAATAGEQVTLNWPPTPFYLQLQTAPTVTGPWTAGPEQSGTWMPPLAVDRMYFRLGPLTGGTGNP